MNERIAAERRRFEKWITAPPYERGVKRWPKDHGRFGWPGHYTSICTQLAWEAWCAALGMEVGNE